MPAPRGTFIWYEVMTTDNKAAAKFCGDVIGVDHARAFNRRRRHLHEVAAAADRALARGAKLLHGPAEVPGGAWIVQARDPQGAAFALVSAQK